MHTSSQRMIRVYAYPDHLPRMHCSYSGEIIFYLTIKLQSFIFNRMVKYTSVSLDKIFSALSDPTRRAIVEKLAKVESSVTELAEPFDISLPAISKHLDILEDAGLILRTKDGRIHRCTLRGTPIQHAIEWLERYHSFWNEKFHRLDAFLEKSAKKRPT